MLGAFCLHSGVQTFTKHGYPIKDQILKENWLHFSWKISIVNNISVVNPLHLTSHLHAGILYGLIMYTLTQLTWVRVCPHCVVSETRFLCFPLVLAFTIFLPTLSQFLSLERNNRDVPYRAEISIVSNSLHVDKWCADYQLLQKKKKLLSWRLWDALNYEYCNNKSLQIGLIVCPFSSKMVVGSLLGTLACLA